MDRIDFGGAVMALLTGFVLSAGLTAFVVSAGGYQPTDLLPPRPALVTAAGAPGAAIAAPPIAVQAPAAPAASAAPTEIKVTATDLKFGPPALKVKFGQPVKIELVNNGAIEHDIHFPTLKADKPAASLQAHAKAGKTATLEFTPTAKGTYEYICTIPGHKEAGMKGKIDVVD